jgi:hypothetical protein
MPGPRSHIEMAALDLQSGWEQLAGFPKGLEVKLLSNDLDETNKKGARTRAVRFAPGAKTTQTLIHDYWEEVFVLSGDLSPLEVQSANSTPTYSCRPPGTPHGPFGSQSGCLLLEVQYYVKD